MSSSERQTSVKTEKSWLRRFFLLSINSFLIYLLIDLPFFLNASYFFLGFFIFFTLIDLNRRRADKSFTREKNKHRLDIVRLAAKYVNVNRIYVLATVLGLILATVIISQTVLLSTSYQQDSFDDFRKNVDTTGIVFQYEKTDSSSFNTLWNEKMNELPDFLQENDLDYNYSEGVTKFSANMKFGDWFDSGGGYSQLPSMRVWVSTDYTRIFEKISSLPSYEGPDSLPNQPFLVLPSYDLDAYGLSDNDILNSNNSIELLITDTYIDSNDISLIKYTEVYDPEIIYFTDKMIEEYYELYGWQDYDTTRLGLYTNQTYQDQLYTELVDNVPTGFYYYESFSYRTNVYLKLPLLTGDTIDRLIDNLINLNNAMWNWILDESYNYGVWLEYWSPLLEALENYKEAVSGINVVLFLVSGPLIALAIYLVYFSLTLVEQRKRRLISIMKIRGSSRDQLNIMLLGEVIIATMISVLVGMVLSIPWTIISLSTEGFLEFNFGNDVQVVVPGDWYWRLPVIGMILSLNLNIASIISLSKTSIDEAEIAEEKKAPFWQRYYLDLVLFFLSIAYWIGIRIIPMGENAFIITYLSLMIGPFMLLIFLIGAPLVIARYFSQIIGRFSNFMGRNFRGLSSLAIRNMQKNKFSASRLASFLLMGMMLSYVAVIIPGTFVGWGQETQQYALGSDIYIDNLDFNNQTQLDLLDIEGVEAYSEVTKATLELEDRKLGRMYILGIDPGNFADSAYWKNGYDEKNLETIVASIKDNKSIGMQSYVLESIGSEVGDSYPLNIQGVITSLDITTEFIYFPNLVTSLPYSDGDTYYSWEGYMLAHNEFVKNLSTNSMQLGAYIKVEKGANITEVAESLREVFEHNSTIAITSVDDQYASFIEGPLVSILLSALQGMLILTLIASVIAVTYFSFITLSERKREIGVFRALGMIHKQIFSLLVTEGIILLGVSIILGGLSGYFITVNFFYFIDLVIGAGRGVPPLQILIPWDIVAQFTLLIALFTVIAAAVPASITANKQTGSILRAE